MEKDSDEVNLDLTKKKRSHRLLVNRGQLIVSLQTCRWYWRKHSTQRTSLLKTKSVNRFIDKDCIIKMKVRKFPVSAIFPPPGNSHEACCCQHCRATSSSEQAAVCVGGRVTKCKKRFLSGYMLPKQHILYIALWENKHVMCDVCPTPRHNAVYSMQSRGFILSPVWRERATWAQKTAGSI